MRKALFVIFWIFSTAAAPASVPSGPMAAVHRFIDRLNNGAQNTARACANPSSIVDEFPPHEWQGPTACADWLRDFEVNSKREGITDEVVTLGKPRHVDVTNDRAYVVVPAAYAYKQHGKAITENGSILTVALREYAGVWRITGWAWAKA